MMLKLKSYTDESYIRGIQEGNEKVIDHFYTYCRDYFRRTYKKLFQEEDLEADFFQESFVKLWKEIRRCSIFVQDSQVYKINASDMELLLRKGDEEDITTHAEDLKSKIVSECVMNLPASCYKIISLFYYEQKNYDEIMEISDNYTSKDALKTRKYKCMEQLQRRIEEKFNMYNLKPYVHERGNFR